MQRILSRTKPSETMYDVIADAAWKKYKEHLQMLNEDVMDNLPFAAFLVKRGENVILA